MHSRVRKELYTKQFLGVEEGNGAAAARTELGTPMKEERKEGQRWRVKGIRTKEDSSPRPRRSASTMTAATRASAFVRRRLNWPWTAMEEDSRDGPRHVTADRRRTGKTREDIASTKGATGDSTRSGGHTERKSVEESAMEEE